METAVSIATELPPKLSTHAFTTTHSRTRRPSHVPGKVVNAPIDLSYMASNGGVAISCPMSFTFDKSFFMRRHTINPQVISKPCLSTLFFWHFASRMYQNKRVLSLSPFMCCKYAIPLMITLARHFVSFGSPHPNLSVCRLQAWAALISDDKRSLACRTKARSPAEVVGAHLRFLARTGTWERLLLDLHQTLETAFFERKQAVELLSVQANLAAHGAPGHARLAYGEL